MRSQSTPISMSTSSVCSLNSGARTIGVGYAVELHGRRHQFVAEFVPALVDDRQDHAVGPHLLIAAGLQRILHRRPRAVEGCELRRPLLQRSAGEHFAQDLARFVGVGSQQFDGNETRVVDEVGTVQVRTRVGPKALGLHLHQRDVTVVGGAVHTYQRIAHRPGGSGRCTDQRLVVLHRHRDAHAHRPQTAAQQRHVDHRRFTGAQLLHQRGSNASGEVRARNGVAIRGRRAAESCLPCRWA